MIFKIGIILTNDITDKTLDTIRQKTNYPFLPVMNFNKSLKKQLEPTDLLFYPTAYFDDKMQGIGNGNEFYNVDMIEKLKFLGQNSSLYRYFLRNAIEKQLEQYNLACQWISLFKNLICKYSVSRVGIFTCYLNSIENETIFPKLEKERRSLLDFSPADLLNLELNHLIFFEK